MKNKIISCVLTVLMSISTLFVYSPYLIYAEENNVLEEETVIEETIDENKVDEEDDLYELDQQIEEEINKDTSLETENELETLEETIVFGAFLSSEPIESALEIDISNLTGKGIVFKANGEDGKTFIQNFMEDKDATIVLTNTNTNKEYKFTNEHCEANDDYSELTLLNKGKFNHKANFLAASYVENGNYKITISSDSKEYVFEKELKGILEKVPNSVKNTIGNFKGFADKEYPNCLIFSMDEITSDSNWKYFKSLINAAADLGTKEYNSYNPGKEISNIYTGGCIEFINSEGISIAKYGSNGTTGNNTKPYYTQGLYAWMHGKNMGFNLQTLIDRKVVSGEYTIKLYAPGYEPYELKNINLSLCDEALDSENISQASSDDGLRFSFDSNANDDWLLALAKNTLVITQQRVKEGKATKFDYFENVNYGGGSIKLYVADDNYIELRNYEKDKVETKQYECIIDKENENYGSIIISKEVLESNNISAEDIVTVEFSPEGYLPTTKELTSPEEIDENKVSATTDEYGNLAISCSDETKANEYIECLQKGFITFEDGTKIALSEDNLDGSKIKITANQIQKTNPSLSGQKRISISSRGFVKVDKEIVLPYITGNNKILYNEKTKFIVNLNNDDYSFTWSLKQNGSIVSDIDEKFDITDDDNKVYEIGIKNLDFSLKNAGTKYQICVDIEKKDKTKTYHANYEVELAAPKIIINNNKSSVDTYLDDDACKMSVTAALEDSTDVSSYLKYTSANEDIATVDEYGNVTFKSNGKVDIVAYIGNYESKTTFDVYKYNNDKAIELSLENNVKQLEVGEKYKIDIKYDDNVKNEEFKNLIDKNSFAYNATYLDLIEDNGIYYLKAKKVNKSLFITLSIDSSKYIIKGQKTATLSDLSIINKVYQSIDYFKIGETKIEDEYVIEKDKIGNKLQLIAYGTGSNGVPNVEIGSDCVKYAVVDPKIATVSTSGQVVPKATGKTTITATITTNPKNLDIVTKDFVINVVDYAPKLDTNKITIEKFSTGSVRTNLYPIYDETITSVSITTNEYFDVSYVEGNSYFDLSVAEENWAKVSNGKQNLHIVTNKGEFDYDLTISIKNVTPKLQVKTLGSYNSFTNEYSGLALECSENVRKIEFANNWVVDKTDKLVSNNLIEINKLELNAENKIVKSGKVKFYFDGYTDDKYVEKSITFKVVSTKPTVKLANNKITVYSPDGTYSEINTVIQLIDKSGNIYKDGVVAVNGVPCSINDGKINLTYTPEKASNSLVVSYKGKGWTSSIDNKLTVAVNSKLPTAKFEKSTINLNTKYCKESEKINISSSTLDEIFIKDIECPEGLKFEDGCVKIDNDELPAKTYKVIVTPKIEGEIELKPITLSIKVTNNDPKFSLKTATLKFNKQCQESIFDEIKLTNNVFGNETVNLTGLWKENGEVVINKLTDGAPDITCKFDGSNKGITVSVDNITNANVGNYKYEIYPDYNGVQGQAYKFTVNIYNKEVTATASIKGNLNQLDLTSVVTATIKLKNSTEEIKNISIDSDYVEFVGKNSDGTFSFKLKEAAKGLKDQTLTENIKVITANNPEGYATTAKFKVARKVPTAKLQPTTVNVYNIACDPGTEVGRTNINITGNGTIREATITPKSKLADVAYDVELDGTDVVVKIKDISKIKSASTASFTIKLEWEGDYNTGEKGIKTTTLTLNVKDVSGNIKSK